MDYGGCPTLLGARFPLDSPPLYRKGHIIPLTGACLVVSACLNFVSVPFPDAADYLAFPAAVLGGVGISLIILLWSELFGCLNPFRIGLYYAAGIIVSSLLLWLFKGLAFNWLWVCTCLIPILSLACLGRAYDRLPEEERPHSAWGSFTFPWKPIVVVALYSFTYGLCERVFSGYLSIHSGLGAFAAGIYAFLGTALLRDEFRFFTLWKVAFPLMIVSLIPFERVLVFGVDISSFCVLASYTLCLIIIMVILGNLSYRYGVNAIWLFGFERAIRLISVQAGISAKYVIEESVVPFASDVVLAILSITLIVVATLFLLSEKHLSSLWGVVLKETSSEDSQHYLKKNRLAEKCRELAAHYQLTQREEEIILLLVQRKKFADIEKELFVANSTVKTHAKHIYQKLGIHSRKELYGFIGIEEGK